MRFGGGVSEGVESVWSGEVASDVVDGDFGEAVGFEGGLFSGSDTVARSGVQDENGGIFRRGSGEDTLDVIANFSVNTDAGGGEDIRNAINHAIGEKRFGFKEGNLGDVGLIDGFTEVGEGFEFTDAEVGAKVIAESIGEAEDFRNGEIIFENFIFDADEDFLLESAAREVAVFGAVTSAGEADGLIAVNIIGYACVENSAGVIIISDGFIEGDGDATDGIDNFF